MQTKLAVLFPGIGYTNTKPLMYYAGKLAAREGYRVLPVNYNGFPRDVKGDPVKMQVCFVSAYEQAEEALGHIRWAECPDVLFIGKSIGTVVAARYARERRVPARQILLTPLVETLRFVDGSAVAFHGTADPWADTGELRRACKEKGVPLHLTEGANHSLETGDVRADIQALAKTMEVIEAFIRE